MEPWVIYALLSAVFAALVAILGKMGVVGVDSTVATAVRAVVMAIAMICAVLALGKTRLVSTIDSRALWCIGLSGLAGAASWFWYFMALKHGPVGGVVGLDRLSVVFAVLLAALFLGERLTWGHAAGTALVTAGVLLLVR